VLHEVIAIPVGVAFLHAFYRTVESRWPTSYMTIISGAAYAAMHSPIRYLLIRFGPVFVTCLFASVSLDRAGDSAVWPVVVIGLAHALQTSGSVVFRMGLRGQLARRLQVMMHLSVTIGVIFSAWLGAAVRGAFDDAVPPTEEITATLWAALGAAVVGAYLVQVSRSYIDDDELFVRSRDSIDSQFWVRAGEMARLSGCDPVILYSFMLVENIQRPRWARVVERILGRLAGPGTYGIMQIHADGPIDDIESVKRALDGPLRNATVPMQPSYGQLVPDPSYLVNLAMKYNASRGYAEMINSAYHWQRRILSP
jgi:hypothetical protein